MIRKCHDPNYELCDWMRRPAFYHEIPPSFDHFGVLDREYKEAEYRHANGPEVTARRNPLYMPVKKKAYPTCGR